MTRFVLGQITQRDPLQVRLLKQELQQRRHEMKRWWQHRQHEAECCDEERHNLMEEFLAQKQALQREREALELDRVRLDGAGPSTLHLFDLMTESCGGLGKPVANERNETMDQVTTHTNHFSARAACGQETRAGAAECVGAQHSADTRDRQSIFR